MVPVFPSCGPVNPGIAQIPSLPGSHSLLPFFVFHNTNNLNPHNTLSPSLSDCSQLHQCSLSHLCPLQLSLDLRSRQPLYTPTVTALGAHSCSGTTRHHLGAARRVWCASVGSVPSSQAPAAGSCAEHTPPTQLGTVLQAVLYESLTHWSRGNVGGGELSKLIVGLFWKCWTEVVWRQKDRKTRSSHSKSMLLLYIRSSQKARAQISCISCCRTKRSLPFTFEKWPFHLSLLPQRSIISCMRRDTGICRMSRG